MLLGCGSRQLHYQVYPLVMPIKRSLLPILLLPRGLVDHHQHQHLTSVHTSPPPAPRNPPLYIPQQKTEHLLVRDVPEGREVHSLV